MCPKFWSIIHPLPIPPILKRFLGKWMPNLNHRVCDLNTWQSFFYLDVLRGVAVGFTQCSAMSARDGGRGQDFNTLYLSNSILCHSDVTFPPSSISINTRRHHVHKKKNEESTSGYFSKVNRVLQPIFCA